MEWSRNVKLPMWIITLAFRNPVTLYDVIKSKSEQSSLLWAFISSSELFWLSLHLCSSSKFISASCWINGKKPQLVTRHYPSFQITQYSFKKRQKSSTGIIQKQLLIIAASAVFCLDVTIFFSVLVLQFTEFGFKCI